MAIVFKQLNNQHNRLIMSNKGNRLNNFEKFGLYLII